MKFSVLPPHKPPYPILWPLLNRYLVLCHINIDVAFFAPVCGPFAGRLTVFIFSPHVKEHPPLLIPSMLFGSRHLGPWAAWRPHAISYRYCCHGPHYILWFLCSNCCCLKWRVPTLAFGLWNQDHFPSLMRWALLTVRSILHVPVPEPRVWALLPQDSWNLSRRRTGGGELLETGTLRLLQNFLAVVSCTTIWDFLVVRQKGKSCMQFIILSRGTTIALSTATLLTNFLNLRVQLQQRICSKQLVSRFCHCGHHQHKRDVWLLMHARLSFLFLCMGCSSWTSNWMISPTLTRLLEPLNASP